MDELEKSKYTLMKIWKTFYTKLKRPLIEEDNDSVTMVQP